MELQTQIEMAVRQQFIKGEEAERLAALANEVGRLINGLLRSLRPKA